MDNLVQEARIDFRVVMQEYPISLFIISFKHIKILIVTIYRDRAAGGIYCMSLGCV